MRAASSPSVRFLPSFVCLLISLSTIAVLLSPDAAAQAPSGPRIWLQANQPLPVQHMPAVQGAAAPSLAGLNSAQPVAMTEADLDADGFRDLIVGYSSGGAGFISIHRGNIDAFAPQSDESFRAIGRGEFPSPFLLDAQTFSVPVSPDFIALGNFLGNGENDLVVAGKSGSALYFFAGDGKGNFGDPQVLNLAGGVLSLAEGEFGSSHQPTLLVGISGNGKNKSALLVFLGSAQGLTEPVTVPVTGNISNILFGEFGDRGADAAFLAGNSIQILRSSTMTVVPVNLPVSVSAFALGSFLFDRNEGQQIAVLGTDGSVSIAARKEFDPRAYTNEEFGSIRQAKRLRKPVPLVPARTFAGNGWKIVESFPSVAAISPNQAPVFLRTRISVNGADDIMWLSAASGQMVLISHPDQQPGSSTFNPGQISVKPYTGTPLMALPMRINVDGRLGVMALHQGDIAPSMSMPIPDPTFFVNTDNDPTPTAPITNACNNTSFSDLSSSCSLREAVLKANGDTIMLQAGHTYSLTIGRPASPDYTGNHGALYMNHTATIVGGNQNTTIIQWGTPGSGVVDMVMAVNEDISILSNSTGSLSNLTIQKGTNNGTHGNDGDGGCMEFDTGQLGNSNLSLTNVTLQNCATTHGNGGGIAMFNFTHATGTGAATITNSIFQNNSAVDAVTTGTGGGVWSSVDNRLTMSGSQILNNLATHISSDTLTAGVGGGITLTSDGPASNPATIHSTTISGNTAGGFGGGMWVETNLTMDQGSVVSNNSAGSANKVNQTSGGGMEIQIFNGDSATLTKVAITGNSATGGGGGIHIGSFGGGTFPTDGPLTISLSRLAGNTAGTVGSNLSNVGTTVTATNNWWGTNAAGSTISTTIAGATTTFDPFIVLTHTGVPQKIRINQSSTLTGNMSADNHGTAVGLANLTEIIGLPITFNNAVLGTIPQAQPETLNASALATATFNAGGASGFGTANATVDQAVVPVNSNLIASATEAGTTATITTVGAHGYSAGEFVRISGVGVAGYNSSPATQVFTVLSTPTATSFTYTANTSGLGASSGGTANASIIILEPPSITKSFSPKTIQTTGGTGAGPKVSTVTFAITNGNVVPINASFTDSLPTNVGTVPGNLVVAATPNVTNTCGGTVTATAGSSAISFSNAALAVGTCSITVNVSSTVDDIYSNSVTIDSTDAGNGNTASDTLNVINPPTIAKAFGSASIPLNGTTSLSFTVSSTNANQTLSGIAFTDTLPAGLVVATPNGLTNTCSTTPTAVAGSGSISLTGANLAPGASCTISVNVQGTTAGVKNNSVTASDTTAGTGNTATASITVVAPPTISKAFGVSSIPLNGSTTVTFTINNPNTTALGDLTGVAFSDTLPSTTGTLVVAAVPAVSNTCNGTVTATAGTGVISLSGGSVAHNSSCTLSVNVTGTAAGDANNTTGAITSTQGGTGTTSNTALIKIVAPPTITKAFGAASIPVNATTTVTFTITNPAANTTSESGIAFSDTLTNGLQVAGTPGVSNTCGGTVTATANTTTISLSGGSIATPGATCTVIVNVTGTQAGTVTNTTGTISSTNGGTGNASNTATLNVVAPPSVSKTFAPTKIPLNGTTLLTINISNPNSSFSLTGVAFTDNLPAGLVVAGTPNLSNTCGGTATATGGAGSVSLSGGTLASSASCAVSVSVQGTTAGDKNNSVQVSSTEGGNSNTANATVTVVAPPTISKAFGVSSIPLNGTTTVTFTITNPNNPATPANGDLSGIAFTDTLPNATGTLHVAATPGVSNTCGGTVTATAGAGVISLSGGSVAHNSSCTLIVNVTGTTAGDANNTTSAISSTEGGTGQASNTALIKIVAPPTISKAFGAANIALNGTTTVTFTITNPAANTTSESGIAFSDTLTNGLQVASTPAVSNTCSGTVTAAANTTTISLTGGSIATPGTTCTIVVNVTGTQSGTVSNTTGTVSSTNGGTGATSNTATLIVASPATVTKNFGATSIALNGSTSLTINITNPNSNVSLNGLSFTDNLPAGLVVASTPSLTNTCNGTATATAGSGTVSLSGGTIAANNSCSVSVNVTGTTAGVKNNSVTVSSTEGGTSNSASASITVVGPPAINKTFGATSIPLNGSTSLTFTINNPNSTVALNGVSFSDTLPAGLVISTPSGLLVSSGCGSGLVTALQNSTSIALNGATVAASGSCTFSLNVTGTAAGSFTNTTGAVTSNEGGTGGTASATLTVVAPPSIAKVFNPSTISLNATTSLTFTITNPAANTVAEAGVAFADTLPAGLTVASGTSTVCGGTLSTTAPTGISLTGATIAVNSNCQFSVTVTGAASGQYTNTTGNVTSTNGGTGNTATANLTVATPPSISKAFGAATIPLNGTTSLTFNISNPNAGIGLTGVAFTDSLPAGLVIASPPNLTNTCNGTATAVAGSSSVSLGGGTLAANGSCSISVNVTGTTAGVKNNSVTVSSTEGGTGNTSSASITVIHPPEINKQFDPNSIPLHGTTTLTFFMAAPQAHISLSGVGFTDTLPTGLTVANGTATTVCGGTVTTTAPTGISLTGATIAGGSLCQFSVTVTGAAAGSFTNTTGAITSNEGGTGNTASASLTVVAPPSIAKVFNPSPISLNATTSLTFTITNPAANTVALNGVAFTDTLPAGLTVASGTATVCGGTLTTTAPSVIVLTGAMIAVNSNCPFTVPVIGAASGQYINITGAVTSTNGGTGNTATANLTVATPPSISKAFGATTIPLNGTTSLTFNIINPNTGIALTGIALNDNLPAGLVIATPPGLSNTCNGTATAVAGSSSVSLSGGTIAASGLCSVSVNVTGTTAGVKNNSVTVSSLEGGLGNTATASITVVAPPMISKFFGVATIPLNGSTSLNFTIINPNSTVSLTGIAFFDNLPPGLIISTPNGLAGSCGGGTITATQNTNSISLNGATLSANAACTFSVNVTGTAAGFQPNFTGPVTSNEGGTGNTASATVTVLSPPTISKAFGASNIALNGTTSLSFTITNPNSTLALTGVGFTDTLPAGLVISTPSGLLVSPSCGPGLVTALPNTGTITLAGATVATSGSCTFSLNVTGTSAGVKNNTTGNVTSTNGGTGNTATAHLTVASPPTIAKAFGSATVAFGSSTTVKFTITNPNSGLGLTGVIFTDNLPAGLQVSATPGIANTCNGTVTATGGGSSISLSGGTIASAGSCTVTVNVTGAAVGNWNNQTGVVSATESGPGATSNTATITVTKAATTSQVKVTPTSVQYSDQVTLTATLSPDVLLGQSPATTVTFTVGGQTFGPVPLASNGSGALVGTVNNAQILQQQGSYTVTATFGGVNANFNVGSPTTSLTVTREDAVVTPAAANPMSVQVTSPGGTSGAFTLAATIQEVADGSLGDINKAQPVTITLAPVGPGSPASCTASIVNNGGPQGSLTASCSFNNLPVNVYDVTFSVGGNFYQGSAQTAVTVFDPSLGFVTGGGTFIDPVTGFKCNFGLNMKFNKNAQPKGQFLFVEHTPTGDIVIKSNALGAMAIVSSNPPGPFANNEGITTGKAVVNGLGNYSFQVIAIDNGTPGSLDELGLKVVSPGNVTVVNFSPVTLQGGNITVPH